MLKLQLRFNCTGLILGGLPKDLNALAYANEARKEAIGAQPVQPAEIGLDPSETEVKEPLSVNVFRRTPEGILAVDEHVIQAMFREAVKAMERKDLQGIWMYIHTDPYLLPFQYDPMTQITKEVRAFSVVGPQGRRSVVNIHEALIKPVLDLTLEVHRTEKKTNITVEDVISMYSYAGRYIGLGAGRGKSGLEYTYGHFTLEVR
jgi:hypothetical protein